MDHADEARARIPTVLEEVVKPRSSAVDEMVDGESTFAQHAQRVAIHRWLRDV